MNVIDSSRPTHWPQPVKNIGDDVTEKRGELAVPEGTIGYTYRSRRGDSRVWIVADGQRVIVGLTADGKRKLASFFGYSSNDVPGLV